MPGFIKPRTQLWLGLHEHASCPCRKEPLGWFEAGQYLAAPPTVTYVLRLRELRLREADSDHRPLSSPRARLNSPGSVLSP